MDEIKALLEKAENRLEVSRSLFENSYYEDAVSRAYYCMFFAAKALLLAKNISVKTHRGLIRKFGLEFVNRNLIEEYYGRALRIAEELREEADYSISRKISEEEAKSVIDDAGMFLDRIEQMIELHDTE
ncbi:MAG: HEPN domain-containing protein [Methanosarcinales archaeon]|nr:HEPN domain-containing protein [Methanosarcinales archaeon]